MRVIDRQHTDRPVYGVRRMTAHLRSLGHEVNPKRVRRLMHRMGVETIDPSPLCRSETKTMRSIPIS